MNVRRRNVEKRSTDNGPVDFADADVSERVAQGKITTRASTADGISRTVKTKYFGNQGGNVVVDAFDRCKRRDVFGLDFELFPHLRNIVRIEVVTGNDTHLPVRIELPTSRRTGHETRIDPGAERRQHGELARKGRELEKLSDGLEILA